MSRGVSADRARIAELESWLAGFSKDSEEEQAELLKMRANHGGAAMTTVRSKNESIAMRFNGTPMLVERVGCSACGEGVKEVHVTLGNDTRSFDGEWADFFWDIATDTRVRSRLSRESTA